MSDYLAAVDLFEVNNFYEELLLMIDTFTSFL